VLTTGVNVVGSHPISVFVMSMSGLNSSVVTWVLAVHERLLANVVVLLE
jgi:hypothetical protein